MTITTTPSKAVSLQQRGILDAAKSSGWKRYKNGNYRVPTYKPDGTLSIWTAIYNVSPENREKYGKVNLKGKPDDVIYYLRKDTIKAIAANDGRCYFASGLTDVLSYQAAGLPNALCVFAGERAIPDSFADDLKSFGVKELIYLPDDDDTGTESAAKVADKLAGSGIPLTVKKLHDSWHDVNEMWAAFWTLGEPAKNIFEIAIKAAHEVKPEPIAKPTYKPRNAIQGQSEQLQAIYTALGIDRWIATPRGRKSNPILCIFHDDKNPSAVWLENADDDSKLLHCSDCGTYTLVDTAKQLSIQLKPAKINIPESLFAGAKSLPVELRTAILRKRKKHAGLARFFDVLLLNGVELGRQYTVKEIEAATKNCYSAKTIRGYFELIPLFSLYKSNKKSNEENLGTNSPAINKEGGANEVKHARSETKRGRKAKEYYIPTLTELSLQYPLKEVDNLTYSSLPTDALISNKAYRIAQHKQQIKLQQAEWERYDSYPSSKVLARGIGTGKRTVSNYDNELIDANELYKKVRFDDKEVDTDYQLTDKQKNMGAYLFTRKGKTILRTFKTSIRQIIKEPVQLEDNVFSFCCSSLLPEVENPSDEKKLPNLKYCRNCGQSIAADMPEPRICANDKCRAVMPWQSEPPPIPIDFIPPDTRPSVGENIAANLKTIQRWQSVPDIQESPVPIAQVSSDAMQPSLFENSDE